MKNLILGFILLAVTISTTTCDNSSNWLDLFDGKTLDGWKASENPVSVRVENGAIVCQGPRSHFFYMKDGNASFKNFEFKADVMTEPGANSGIYFHTAYQETGWPEKGYEVQVNNTHRGAGDYREHKKTGSLYGVRNIYKQLVQDNEWFTMHIIVRGKHVMIKVNDILFVDYVEPAVPVREENNQGRKLSVGTFALQCHDPDSRVSFKNIKVKILPGDAEDDLEWPVVDETYKQIAQLHAGNFPLVDYHVHLKGDLTLEKALEKSRSEGINYGIAPNCGLGFPIQDDVGVDEFLKGMRNQPVFIGMQAEGREWVKMFSKEVIEKFDYVFTDAMTFFDDDGKRVRLWIKEEVEVPDKQAFMGMYVDRILSVLNDEPIDVYVNPTFLPEIIANEYDALWTNERMQKVVDAAAKNDIAIEINARYKIPSAAFIKMAKQAGVKFTFGTNNSDENFGRLEYCLDMIKECDLTPDDIFIPRKFRI